MGGVGALVPPMLLLRKEKEREGEGGGGHRQWAALEFSGNSTSVARWKGSFNFKQGQGHVPCKQVTIVSGNAIVTICIPRASPREINFPGD